MWYLNAYSYAACLGTEFPVNTYSDKDPEKLAKAAAQLLSRSLSTGVDEVRISRIAEADQVQPLSNSDTEHSLSLHHDEEFVEGLI